jgi:hypothetical protein
MEESMRQAFEAWANDRMWDTSRGKTGNYRMWQTDSAWLGWQAAAAAEREACAKVCDDLADSGYQYEPGKWCYDPSAKECAAAIRNREQEVRDYKEQS